MEDPAGFSPERAAYLVSFLRKQESRLSRQRADLVSLAVQTAVQSVTAAQTAVQSVTAAQAAVQSVPAVQAAVQKSEVIGKNWIPACAGMTRWEPGLLLAQE